MVKISFSDFSVCRTVTLAKKLHVIPGPITRLGNRELTDSLGTKLLHSRLSNSISSRSASDMAASQSKAIESIPI